MADVSQLATSLRRGTLEFCVLSLVEFEDRYGNEIVRRLGEDVVASSVAVVTARPFLTAGSVRDNVTLGATCDDALPISGCTSANALA